MNQMTLTRCQSWMNLTSMKYLMNQWSFLSPSKLHSAVTSQNGLIVCSLYRRNTSNLTIAAFSICQTGFVYLDWFPEELLQIIRVVHKPAGPNTEVWRNNSNDNIVYGFCLFIEHMMFDVYCSMWMSIFSSLLTYFLTVCVCVRARVHVRACVCVIKVASSFSSS